MKKYVKKISKFFFPNIWEYSAPYDYAQDIATFNIHKYLGISKFDLGRILLIGGYKGYEVPQLLRSYPEIHVDIFECSTRHFEKLSKKFNSNSRVSTHNIAISNSNGTSNFYETNLACSGSLLELGNLHKKDHGSTQEECFTVKTKTLDSFCEEQKIYDANILWIDVQGAEKLVLEGAYKTLQNIKAVFIEVSIKPDLYQGSVVFSDLNKILNNHGLSLALLGTGENLTGNALYIRQI